MISRAAIGVVIAATLLLISAPLSGCAKHEAEAAPGVTPPSTIAPVPMRTMAPGHVSGAMRAAQMMKAARPNGVK